SVVDTANRSEIEHIQLFNPEPAHIVEGRQFLYDARITSSNGEASCSSCHIFGDNDGLAWDLGDPDVAVTDSPIPVRLQDLIENVDNLDLGGLLGGSEGQSLLADLGLDLGDLGGLLGGGGEEGGAPTSILDVIDPEIVNGGATWNQFHPMKGPMTTQTLRGMSTHGALHWRGDRANGHFNDDPENPTLEDAFDEELSFKNFIVAYDGLNGMDGTSTEDQMQTFSDFMLSVMLPPNPIRNLDNSLTAAQQRGRNFYFGREELFLIGDEPLLTDRRSDGVNIVFEVLLNVLAGKQFTAGFTCEGCHRLDPGEGFFGTDGFQSFEGETQIIKIPHLRNVYTKVGAFGVAPNEINGAQSNPEVPERFDFQGDQIKVFGVLHDGAIDTVENFLSALVFQDNGLGAGFQTAQERRDAEQSMLAFPTDLAPIVGQQVTIDSTNSEGASRVELSLNRAHRHFESRVLDGWTTEADVVVKGVGNGYGRGYLSTDRNLLGIHKCVDDRHQAIYGSTG